MQTEDGRKYIIRFLKDEKFIELKLFPTEESKTYWLNYLKENPNELEYFVLAEKHFRNINISSHTLSQEKKDKAIGQLKQSILKHKRKRQQKFNIFTSVAAACIAILTVSIIYTQINTNKPGRGRATNVEYIVGNELSAKNVQLITGDIATSFDESIAIEITQEGVAQIKSENKANADIAIAKDKSSRLIVPYGKQSNLMLADGSKIWLNSGSILEFPTSFTGNTRDIYLTSGEIYIEVAPNKQKPFYLHTAGFEVKVYGTALNLTTYNDAPHSIVLVEGSVSLKSATSKEFFLDPNEQAIFSDNGSFSTQEVDVESYISWKEGYLALEKTPMLDVLQLVERYYNVDFDYKQDVNLHKRTCTGKIFLSDSLDNVMMTIGLLSGTKYEKENNHIYIH